MRRLVVCLDGTWNKRDDTTNVWRIYTLAAAIGGGVYQLKYYDQGVGTYWYDRATGGAFGAGMYTNVKQAYTWIAERYRPGDHLFIFGFSRGAATALSLANLIDRCGILSPASTHSFEDAYRLYSLRGFNRDGPASTRFRKHAEDADQDCVLRFIGLFDTVASLFFPRLWGEHVHTLTLPSTATLVVHAIALDENRRMFQSVEFDCAPRHGSLVERWFSGAHANVGGGYAFDPLAGIPLRWMMQHAMNSGLVFNRLPEPDNSAVLATPERNSFEEFAFGTLMLAPLLTKKRRRIGRGVSGLAHESIDQSAIERYVRFGSYRHYSTTLAHFLQDSMPPEGDLDVTAQERS